MGGEPFLIYDSCVGDQERMFTFSSEIGLQLPRESKSWYGDGTFKVCPEIFYQLYTIHGERNGQIFSVVFCLLPDKTQGTYRRMLQQVFDQHAVFDRVARCTCRLRVCSYQCILSHWQKYWHEGMFLPPFFKYLEESSKLWPSATMFKSSLYTPTCSLQLPLCHLITSLRVLRNSLIW